MIPNSRNIEKRLMKAQSRWDSVMKLDSEVIRLAGKTITSMHAGMFRESRETLGKLRHMVESLRKIEKGFEYYSLQAHQEYVEAASLYFILKKRRIPRAEELRESDAAYLLGLLDVVGELKREALGALMAEDTSKASFCYKTMLEIYDSTLPMRFANPITPDFRKKQDTARIQIENLGSDLLSAKKR